MIACICLGLVLTQASDTSYRVKLSSGTVIEIVSITDDFAKKAWHPSGRPMEWVPAFEGAEGGQGPNPGRLELRWRVTANENRKAPVFFARGPHTRGLPHPIIEVPMPNLRGYGEDGMTWAISTSLDLSIEHPRETEMKLGVAEGEWSKPQIIKKYTVDVNLSGYERRYEPAFAVVFDLKPFAEVMYEVSAFSKDGSPLEEFSHHWAKDQRSIIGWRFFGDHRQLGRVEIRTRKIEWAEFKRIKLVP